VIDPYSTAPGGLPALDAAAHAADCDHAEPFCTQSNGILLNVDWCRFEGYPDSQAPPPGMDVSCHYFITGTAGQTGNQTLAPNEDKHSCPIVQGQATSYDECSGSDLSKAIADIKAINVLRSGKGKGRPPLKLSLGLMAGLATPETYLRNSTIGSQSIPFRPASTLVCGVEPDVWKANYVSAYLRAYDEYITYIATNLGAPQIKLIKVTPLNGTTLEYFLPGRSMPITTATDPNTPDVGDPVAVDCSGSDGALKWINAYGTGGSLSVIGAMEKTFGSTVGNLYATLANLNAGLANTSFGISVATNNGEALPEINCGVTSYPTGSCSQQSYSSDEWSIYYLFRDVADLFPSSGSTVALSAAQAASSALGQTFSLNKTNLFVNTTQLQDPTPACGTGTIPDCAAVSVATLSCDLNETAGGMSPDQRSFMLNATATPETGVGTSIGVQTATLLDNASQNPTHIDYCTTTGPVTLDTIFNFGISNGAQFVEITADLATDPDCSMSLQNLVTSLGSANPQTNCLY
jgi:hypothetical protein